MLNIRTIAILAAFLFFVPLGAVAQESTFSDPNVDYSFILPDPGWKQIAKPSATSPNVEYVYNDRREGHLEIRKLAVTKNAILTDIMRDEETKLQFLPGYVAGKEENFSGALRGGVFNYEFLRIGRNMSGRFYFLKADDTTVYVLRFTGERDKLKSLRNQTDSIARTFSIKGPKGA
jgi:hypothetical protein